MSARLFRLTHHSRSVGSLLAPLSCNHVTCHNQSTLGKISHVIDGRFSPLHQHIRDLNRENMDKLKERYDKLLNQALLGGGKRGIERHVVRNKKMLARDRLKLLLDENSPQLEISTLAGLGMKYGDIPCAGLVTVIGKVHGVWCMVCANDATVKGGSVYPVTVKKQLRVQQIAEENRLPVIHLVDSAGAFLPLQSEIFNEGGRTFYNQAVMSSLGIAQIALVCGSCTAGAAYIPAMADEAVILHKTGTIYLGGPPLVLAATGERVTSEQLGGATLHCETSGLTDHFSLTEEDAITKTRDIVATLNVDHALLAGITSGEAPAFDEEELDELAPASHKFHQLNVKLILARLVDGSRFHEFKSTFASELVCGFATIQGNMCGIVASNGRLTGRACLKGAHFVQLCSQRGVPIIYLQHFEGGQSNEDNNIDLNNSTVKGRAQMLQAVSCASSPSITITTGGVTGSPHSHALGSLATGSRFHFIFPNARVGCNDPVTLTEQITQQLQEQEEDEQQTRKEVEMKKSELLKKLLHQTDSFHSAALVINDGVILPRDCRDVIANCLSIFKQADTMTSSQQMPKQTMFRM